MEIRYWRRQPKRGFAHSCIETLVQVSLGRNPGIADVLVGAGIAAVGAEGKIGWRLFFPDSLDR